MTTNNAMMGWTFDYPKQLQPETYRALMQLLVGVEQGHKQVKDYAAQARKLIDANPIKLLDIA